MFNTPLGKKLYENMMGLGVNIMSGKAALYSNPIKMIEDFVNRKDGFIHFSKKFTFDDLETLIVYINDYTSYRFDIKINKDCVSKKHIVDILNEYMIEYDDLDSNDVKKSNINDRKRKIAFWNSPIGESIKIIINTGESAKSVLVIDVKLT